MSALAEEVLTLNAKSKTGVLNLIERSHAAPMDFNTALPWENGVDLQQLPKPLTQSWIYGTSYFDALTATQQHELLWKETARDVSMFITLEQTLPQLYMGYVTTYPAALSPEITDYLMVFSKEEIVHTMVFQRYMKSAGLPLFVPAEGLFDLLTKQLPAMPPVAGVICTLIIEWVAELAAMHASQSEQIEPLTRAMFYNHHVDESRHIAFGRWIAESYFDTASPEQTLRTRQLIQGVLARLIPQFTYNPEIAHHTSFRFPIQPDDTAAIDTVRNSAANQQLNQQRFAPLFRWLQQLDTQ